MEVLVGIDGGGTYTRVAMADTEGTLLAFVKRQGGAFLYKDANAEENVRLAVLEALEKAGCALGDVIGLAAGIAGYDKKRDLRWVRKLTKIKGLRCPIEHVNDAVAAQRGAFLFGPGIIAIAGTGSVIAGITETGKFIRNYDFKHYANNAACNLTYNSVGKILAGETDDTNFTDKLLQYLGAEDVDALKALKEKDFNMSYAQKLKLLGDFAPAVTTAALDGSRLARQVCVQAAEETIEGIRLLGGCFTSASIFVALIGSVANSAFIRNTIGEMLREERNAGYTLIEPALPPALGAVLMAARLTNIEANPFQEKLIESYHIRMKEGA